MLFALNERLNLISKSKIWLGDGTFSIVPRICFELYVLHIPWHKTQTCADSKSNPSSDASELLTNVEDEPDYLDEASISNDLSTEPSESSDSSEPIKKKSRIQHYWDMYARQQDLCRRYSDFTPIEFVTEIAKTL